jgi:hypothetical protein
MRIEMEVVDAVGIEPTTSRLRVEKIRCCRELQSVALNGIKCIHINGMYT